MIIQCINCNKKFNVDPSLIPATGRKIKCGSCDYIWFYNPNIDNQYQINPNNTVPKKILTKKINEKNEILDQKDNLKTKIRKKKTNSLSFGKILSYLIVIIISFVALILVIETFKSHLIIIFPGLELILYNLFESIKDVFLFIKDLSD